MSAWQRTRRGWGIGADWPLVVVWLGHLGTISVDDERTRFIPLSERRGIKRGCALMLGRLRLEWRPPANTR